MLRVYELLEVSLPAMLALRMGSPPPTSLPEVADKPDDASTDLVRPPKC
jgi:hypothetical protein